MTRRPDALIVDGHSIIFARPELAVLHHRGRESARQRLISELARFGDATGVHVAVVFDGRGPRAVEDHAPPGIQVFYSGSRSTADSVIERLVAKYADRFRIRVATDDHMEQTTVSSFGAEWLSSAQLLAEIRAAEAHMEETLRVIRRAPPGGGAGAQR